MAKNPTATGPIEIAQPKVLRAFRPGDVVFLEMEKPASEQQMQYWHQLFKQLIPDIRVIILQAGVRVAASPGVDPWACPDCDGITPKGVLEHTPLCPNHPDRASA